MARSSRPAMPRSPQEQAAAEVASRVLGATVRNSTESGGMSLVYPNGRRAALEEVTVGERDELDLAHLRRESDMRWPVPGRWWWQVEINDVRGLPRVREAFPVAARLCEANDVRTLDQLSASLTWAVPDLHWLVHTMPARLVGHPGVLDHPATVTLGQVQPTDQRMASVAPAVRDWLASRPALRAITRLGQRRARERQLYLTVGCSEVTAEAFDSLVRASGVPPAPPPPRLAITHLWLAPVLGRTVYLWSRGGGWSRHEPYG
jgi:hypothetical protein